MVGVTIIRLRLGSLHAVDLLDVEAVAALPVVGLCWVEVLTEDIVWSRVGVRSARVLRHIAKSIVTQVLVSRGSRCSSASE